MIDLKLTLAVILAMAVQAAGAFMWAGEAGARLSALEARVAVQEGAPERLARLETGVAQANARLERIEAKLDRL